MAVVIILNHPESQMHEGFHKLSRRLYIILIKGSLDEKLPSYEVLKMLKE